MRGSRTKIVCTIGPASESPETIERLIVAGMDVARLNFSHGTHERHAEAIAAIRDLSARRGRPVAVLQDLGGLKIRVGEIADGPVTLEPGATFTLTARPVPGDAQAVSITYAGLPRDVRAGDTLLLSDGDLELRVVGTTDVDVTCEVVIGGQLLPHKGINLPTRSVAGESFTDRDRRDLAFGLRHEIDFVALSFVRSAADVRAAAEFMEARGRRVPMIAKIEKHEAVAALDEILDVVDGVMVARGDLGVEIPLARVPRVQKSVIERANRAGKPVITATHMLRSMVHNPRPTRAEVADVANAVLDGTDAVMLSEETAIGRDPVEAVATMRRIAEEAETSFPYEAALRRYTPGTPSEAVARAACLLAEDLDAAAIVTLTESGSTARLAAKYRPRCPILAATRHAETCRRLALIWGVVPILTEPAPDTDRWLEGARAAARAAGHLPPGARIVITAGFPPGQPGTTNLIKTETVP
jgi:pyruvate kinase